MGDSNQSVYFMNVGQILYLATLMLTQVSGPCTKWQWDRKYAWIQQHRLSPLYDRFHNYCYWVHPNAEAWIWQHSSGWLTSQLVAGRLHGLLPIWRREKFIFIGSNRYSWHRLTSFSFNTFASSSIHGFNIMIYQWPWYFLKYCALNQ